MTGLDPTYPWWHALAHEYKPRDRSQRFLTPAQAGMLIQLLEGVRALEDRSNDAVFGALQLVWLIVQRSAAIVGMESLKSEQWRDDPVSERAGWRVFTWIADNVKGKRATKLSIPPIAIAVIERVAKNAKALTDIDSNWAFPQARNIYLLRSYANSNNRDGIRQYDKHITPSALNHALDSAAKPVNASPLKANTILQSTRSGAFANSAVVGAAAMAMRSRSWATLRSFVVSCGVTAPGESRLRSMLMPASHRTTPGAALPPRRRCRRARPR